MDDSDIKYTDLDEFVVRVDISGENISHIPVFVFFNQDGNPIVQLKCFNILNFKGKEIKGIIACNKMNNELCWVKFYLDSDGDIIASVDAYIDDDSCGKMCINLIKRLVQITDAAYPAFVHALMQ